MVTHLLSLLNWSHFSGAVYGNNTFFPASAYSLGDPALQELPTVAEPPLQPPQNSYRSTAPLSNSLLSSPWSTGQSSLYFSLILLDSYLQ